MTTFPEDVQIQEIDERHFLALQTFTRREVIGWSQEDLAGAAGMTQAQIANIEAGQANPTLRTLTKLAYTFGCGITNLLSPAAAAWHRIDWQRSYSHDVILRAPAPAADMRRVGWGEAGAALTAGVLEYREVDPSIDVSRSAA